MTQSRSLRASPAPAGFQTHLRAWRQRERLPQLELGLRAGVSQRHLSHLESGRALPSRAMVLLLGQTLNASLREQNEALLAAGFAPAFQTSALDNPAMAPVLEAVQRMLTHHEPYPAVAVDRLWNPCRYNTAFGNLVALLSPGAPGPINLLRMFFHPAGLRPWVANWDQAAPLLWQRACREAEADGTGQLRALLAELGGHGAAPALAAAPPDLVPVLPLVLAQGDLRLSLFSVIATFGTAQDVTTDELRIECFFPADEPSKALLQRIAGAAPPPPS